MRTRTRLCAAGIVMILAMLPALSRAQVDPIGHRTPADPIDPIAGQGALDTRTWTVAPVPNLASGNTLGTLWVSPTGTVYVWSYQMKIAAPYTFGMPRLEVGDDPPLPGGGGGALTFIVNSQLLAVNGTSSQVVVNAPNETGVSIFGTAANDVYAATTLPGNQVRLYHFDGYRWRLERLPGGITGPAGSVAGETGQVFFRTGNAILVGHDREWSVAYMNDNLKTGGELAYVGHNELLASGFRGLAVLHDTEWSWQSSLTLGHVNGAWGTRDAMGELHMFATGDDPYHCGMMIWQYAENTPGGMQGSYLQGWTCPHASVPNSGTGLEVWGAGPHDIMATGFCCGKGMVMHFDGSRWIEIAPLAVMPKPTGIGAAPNGDVWIALKDGRLVHGVLRMPTPGVTTTPVAAGLVAPNAAPGASVERAGSRTFAVEFQLVRPAEVSLAVYSANGRHVATLDRSQRGAGLQRVTWDARGVPRGVYFCRIEAAGTSRTVRILVD